MIGADTSFLIDFLNGDKKSVLFMQKHKEVIFICEQVIYEFLCGNLSDKEKELFLGFISQFPVFVFDRNASIRSSNLYRKYKKKGKTISHPDMMIAGTYITNNVNSIVTRNSKHFKEVNEINIKTY